MSEVQMRDIPGLEGRYAATTDGRIWSYRKRKGPRFLRGNRHSRGYIQVTLMVNERQVRRFVHRLVAMTWIPNEKRLPQVNHKNLNKRDNRAENLEWCTRSQNCRHAVANGRWPRLRLLPNSLERDPAAAKKGLSMKEQIAYMEAAFGALGDSYAGPIVASLKRLAEAEKTAATHNATIAERDKTIAALLARCEKAEARLAKAIESLKQWASECGECDGNGLRTIYNYDGNGSDADDQPCDQCEDIRAAIKDASHGR